MDSVWAKTIRAKTTVFSVNRVVSEIKIFSWTFFSTKRVPPQLSTNRRNYSLLLAYVKIKSDGQCTFHTYHVNVDINNPHIIYSYGWKHIWIYEHDWLVNLVCWSSIEIHMIYSIVLSCGKLRTWVEGKIIIWGYR